jgi:hypothetical protein
MSNRFRGLTATTPKQDKNRCLFDGNVDFCPPPISWLERFHVEKYCLARRTHKACERLHE